MQMGVLLERVRFVMKNYASGPSILENVFCHEKLCKWEYYWRVRFVMKNYASGPSILENVFCHEKLCK